MRQTFKIMRGVDKLDRDKIFEQRQETTHTRTAGDPLHLKQGRSRLDIRANTFSQRVVRDWNAITYEKKSKSLSVFKKPLKTTMNR